MKPPVIVGTDIPLTSLLVIRKGITLEMKGLMKHGKSCTAMAKELMGLPKNLSKVKTLEKFEDYMVNNGIDRSVFSK